MDKVDKDEVPSNAFEGPRRRARLGARDRTTGGRRAGALRCGVVEERVNNAQEEHGLRDLLSRLQGRQEQGRQHRPHPSHGRAREDQRHQPQSLAADSMRARMASASLSLGKSARTVFTEAVASLN